MSYYEKYIKYKRKYLELQNQMGGGVREFRLLTDDSTVLILNDVNKEAESLIRYRRKLNGEWDPCLHDHTFNIMNKTKQLRGPEREEKNLAFMSSIDIDWENDYKKLVPNPMCLGEYPKTTGQPLKLRIEGDRKIICIDGVTLPCDPFNKNGLVVSNIYRVVCTKHNKRLDTDDGQLYIYIFKVSPPPGQSTPGYIFYPHKLSDTSGNEILKDDLSDIIPFSHVKKYSKIIIDKPTGNEYLAERELRKVNKHVQKELRKVMENIRRITFGQPVAVTADISDMLDEPYTYQHVIEHQEYMNNVPWNDSCVYKNPADCSEDKTPEKTSEEKTGYFKNFFKRGGAQPQAAEQPLIYNGLTETQAAEVTSKHYVGINHKRIVSPHHMLERFKSLPDDDTSAIAHYILYLTYTKQSKELLEDSTDPPTAPYYRKGLQYGENAKILNKYIEEELKVFKMEYDKGLCERERKKAKDDHVAVYA